jgi:hypothetical protein
MIDAIQASEIVSRTPRDKIESGAAARWVNIDAYWGIKYFANYNMRDLTHERQSLAYSLGMAPAIGDKIDFKLGDETWYGYTCERIVETAYEAIQARNCLKGYSGENFENVAYRTIRGYKEILRYHGLTLADMHNANWGFNANGDIVVIDFSHCEDWMRDS